MNEFKKGIQEFLFAVIFCQLATNESWFLKLATYYVDVSIFHSMTLRGNKKKNLKAIFSAVSKLEHVLRTVSIDSRGQCTVGSGAQTKNSRNFAEISIIPTNTSYLYLFQYSIQSTRPDCTPARILRKLQTTLVTTQGLSRRRRHWRDDWKE